MGNSFCEFRLKGPISKNVECKYLQSSTSLKLHFTYPIHPVHRSFIDALLCLLWHYVSFKDRKISDARFTDRIHF